MYQHQRPQTVGISWNRKLGDTADFTRLDGGGASVFRLVGGVRMWFERFILLLLLSQTSINIVERILCMIFIFLEEAG
ncbi:MAG: copper resistance protein B [Cyclonatronaceae bacterium]